MKILVSMPLPGDAIRNLCNTGHSVEVLPEDRPHSHFIEKLSSANGIISLLSDQIDKAALDLSPCLRVISNYAAGYNNIDVQECSKRGIIVTNTPDALTDATADIAFMLILMAMRRAPEAMSFLGSGKFVGWKPDLLLGRDLRGKNLGILGLGRIGRAVARRGEAFGMRVQYHTRSGPKPVVNYPFLSFCDLLSESDVISCHLPLTSETRHIIGGPEIKKMKKNAVLINTSRGPIIDETALAKALSENQILAAGLDVFENEPFINPILLKLTNVVLLPHIGSATFETRSEMAQMAANSLLDSLEGRISKYLVNPEVLLGGEIGVRRVVLTISANRKS